jgi:2-C-methyl-D-erythritol 4-phosphate cytidylyltransferase
MPSVSAIVVAAGSGERLGPGPSKAFRLLAGKPLLERSLETFAAVDEIVEVVLVLRAEDLPRWEERARAAPAKWKVSRAVAGGAERFDSVRAGLRAIDRSGDLVLVHDAARPLVRAETVRRLVEVAARVGGAIAGSPSTDTLKRVGSGNRILGTLERAEIWRAETPQVFRREPFQAAVERMAREKGSPTDDAAVAEHAGIAVEVVPTDGQNPKITLPVDLAIAEFLLERGRGGGR